MSYYPALIVNNFNYRGDWEVQSVLSALCAGYNWNEEPKICDNPEEPDTKEKAESNGQWVIVLILVLCFALVTAIIVFYRLWVRREMKEEMRVQVNSAVSQYFALSDVSPSRNNY